MPFSPFVPEIFDTFQFINFGSFVLDGAFHRVLDRSLVGWRERKKKGEMDEALEIINDLVTFIDEEDDTLVYQTVSGLKEASQEEMDRAAGDAAKRLQGLSSALLPFACPLSSCPPPLLSILFPSPLSFGFRLP